VKRWLVRGAFAGAALAALAVLAVASGVVPIKASSGHWSITSAILHFAMQRSVATHSLGSEPVPLDPASLEDEALVVKGAGHYHTGCLPCHGRPEAAYFSAVVRGMTPPPPFLPPEIRKWDPDELFYIVKHGVKFTGMPAFPSQVRDDEVRAVVAFLLKLPDLRAEEYERLAHGEARPRGIAGAPPDPAGADPTLRRLVAGCARCHGEDGLGRGAGAFPKLAGQHRAYLENQLVAFARGERHSGIMQPIAAGLAPDAIRGLAAHYAGLPGESAHSGGAPAQGRSADAAAISRGEAIALRGIPESGVPSCRDCHGPGGGHNPAYPGLPGQYAPYLELQLQLFHDRKRGGSAYAHLMEAVAPRLTAEQMRDVAAYYGSLAFGAHSH
jgi:cytochrome c553